MLKTDIPKLDQLDIGIIFQPLRKISGDYVYFLFDEENYLSVAVADVVGKGVPAALCMSMVKNGLEKKL
ncbi:Sigma-B regulation protein RsbU (Phosphoserine phosphatase) OS=Ureibacillus acetophenoni OX=614649 GN=SAMN05877842_111149 PE=4 SV=1 [Ureibacillus acetophenoni]